MNRKINWIGTCLGGRYRIEAILAQGGMSHVYLAEDMKLKGKRWAVKECMPLDGKLTSFLEEAEMLATLQHPQLPQLVDYFTTEEGKGFLVMDYIQGPTLQDLFDQQGRDLPVAQIVSIAFQLCDLFHYLHTFEPRPIIYRDLKPSNVMLNEHDQVRLIDFGVARHYERGKQSDTVQMGTIGFAAPEQFHGDQTDARTDLYTLGSMLYYLLSRGQYAYLTQKLLGHIRSGLPEVLTTTIQLLLQENPQHRCQSALEVKMRLRSIYSVPSPLQPEMLHSDQPNLTTSSDKLIVIGSLFAGAGSTFAAISLARILHARQIPNAVVEEPTIEPDLYMLLYGDIKAPKDYAFSHHLVTEQKLSTAASWTAGFTTWVPVHPDGLSSSWHPADTFKLLYTIKKPIVIWDVSTNWEEAAVQELCHSADEIVVLLDASPGKCHRPRSRALFELFMMYQKRGKKVHFVANGNLPGQYRKEWLDALPTAPLCTMPEISRGEVMQAVMKGECIQDRPDILEQLSDALSPLLHEILPASMWEREASPHKKSWFSRFKQNA
ncbi:serine/threonine protein kinase [Paenibacillus alba]|uniref:non-specific serine/threonine protein kinase n=1 Tax=Paenibacillus alba TaxID=1197127 RepID=A0ABU6G405_9BACL|nr:serine/threonine-protein kinase [Paenibacillus alba]MEC0228389.1 serine/threonine-protein kinase [Paenibacillus alba]